MSEAHIGYLMDDSHREIGSARRFIHEGVYPKSINDSYYATFYAAKACLLHLGIKSKNHKSVQMGIDQVVGEGHLPQGMEDALSQLFGRRNEAVYRYARRNWTEEHATDSLHLAEGFVEAVRKLIAGS